MSKEFIEERIGSYQLRKAVDQQKQIQYFTRSEIQKDISEEYITQWAAKKYRTNDYFLNYIKTISRTDNFLTFFKHFRNPNPSSGLVNDTLIPSLSRVFYSEDSYFKYSIRGESVSEPEELDCDHFNSWIFRALLLRHNDILIHDLKETNKPYRYLVDIENVVAIESENSTIYRIAYTGCIVIDDVEVRGFVYLDDTSYKFYDEQYQLLVDEPHDLGECPADYITRYSFDDKDVVRLSIFSHVREKLEEYTFLKTLQKINDFNGTFPITTKLKTQNNKVDNESAIDQGELPMSSGKIPTSSSPLQAGTVIEIPVLTKENGEADMEMVEKFFKFFHMPVDILKFINERVQQVEQEITLRILGDFKERNEEAMNRSQVKKGYVSAEDRLRLISQALTRIRKRSDYKMLALSYGKDAVNVDVFYGSDFFLDSEQDLYDMFEKSPNTIERRNIIKKIASTRYRFNPDRSLRESILYDLIPFVSDKDFELAQGAIDDITIQYQTRFNYWIAQVEAEYGDIVEIWESMEEVPNSQKLTFLNNLVVSYITNQTAQA